MDEQEAGTKRSQEDQEIESSEHASSMKGSESAAEDDGRDPQKGRSGDALAWLEGPAFNAPIEEMPTLQWPDVKAEADPFAGEQEPLEPNQAAGDAQAANEPPDDLEDAIQWLEELARKQGTPIEEMPTLVSGGDSEQGSSAAAPTDSATGATTQPLELDSDPMAWLEQLAIDQDTPLEELPSVANRLLASEIVSQYDANVEGELAETAQLLQVIELDDALIYLEEQAKAQGISLEDVTFDDDDPPESLDKDLDALDKIAVAALAAGAVTHDGGAADVQDVLIAEDVPEGQDDALAVEPVVLEEELAVEGTGLDPQDLIAAKVALDEEETPAGSGTFVEEAPPLAEREKDDWDDLSAQIPDDPDAALAWLGALAEADESQEEENGSSSALAKGAAAVIAGRRLHSDKEEVGKGQAEPGTAAGEKALDRVILEEMPDDPDEAMAWMEGLAGQAEEAQGEQETSESSADGEGLPADPLDDLGLAPEPDFDLARAALASGNITVAAATYRKMLDQGQGGAALVAELETAVAGQPQEPELAQLLGDAYMQNGQIQKAMKSYHKGFDHL